jgi:hypothetical protein
MIWRDRFATPGYSSMLNPTHGRRLPHAVHWTIKWRTSGTLTFGARRCKNVPS